MARLGHCASRQRSEILARHQTLIQVRRPGFPVAVLSSDCEQIRAVIRLMPTERPSQELRRRTSFRDFDFRDEFLGTSSKLGDGLHGHGRGCPGKRSFYGTRTSQNPSLNLRLPRWPRETPWMLVPMVTPPNAENPPTKAKGTDVRCPLIYFKRVASPAPRVSVPTYLLQS